MTVRLRDLLPVLSAGRALDRHRSLFPCCVSPVSAYSMVTCFPKEALLAVKLEAVQNSEDVAPETRVHHLQQNAGSVHGVSK